MQRIKILIGIVVISLFVSCRSKPIIYDDRVAQDLNYRLGKWYSVTDSTAFQASSNTLLDTIWFLTDSMAGWTGFGGNPYVFWKTYFKGFNQIVYLAPNPLDTTIIDTVINDCGMNAAQDTFGIYWSDGFYGTRLMQYVKMK